MTALVIPLAMTTNVEVISMNKVVTWVARLILVSMIPVLMDARLVCCTAPGVPVSLCTYSKQASFKNVRLPPQITEWPVRTKHGLSGGSIQIRTSRSGGLV